jgi:hypothetical protein
MKNIKMFIWIVLSILLPKNLSGNTNNLILSSDSVKTDTVSKKVINIYLTKGLEARKLVFVLRRQIVLDSQMLLMKDTIISRYEILNKDLDSRLKKEEDKLAKAIQKEQTEYFWKRVFQGATLFFAALFVAK